MAYENRISMHVLKDIEKIKQIPALNETCGCVAQGLKKGPLEP